MEDKIDVSVDSFFSKFDNAETNEINTSDSLSDTQEVIDKKEDIIDDSDKSDNKDESKTAESKEDKDVPFHEHKRWKQKIASEKKLKESNKSLQNKYDLMQKEIEALKNKPLTDEQLEGMSNKEVMEYTRKQMQSEFSEKELLSTKEKEEADKYIDDALENLQDNGYKFDENKLLSFAEKYTSGDIDKAFELYQKLETVEKQGAEKEAINSEKKKQAESNSSNRGIGGKVSGYTRGTSWNNLNLK